MNALTDKINIFLRSFSKKKQKSGQDVLFCRLEISISYKKFTVCLYPLDNFGGLCYSVSIKVADLMELKTEYRC